MIVRELSELGNIGLLLVAFISNAVPFSTVPYLVFIAPLLARQHGMEQVFSILVLALGASLGKLVVYGISRFVAGIGGLSRSVQNLVNLTHRFKRATFITVFLVAALPIPDDVFYVPVGISKYSVPLFFLALFMGKIIVTALTAIYGWIAVYILEGVIGLPPIVSIPLMIALSIALTWLINKVDWNEVARVYDERGFWAALLYIAESIYKIAVLGLVIKFKSLLGKH